MWFAAIVVSIFIKGLVPETFVSIGLLSDSFMPNVNNGTMPFIINLFIIILTALLFNRLAVQFQLVKEQTLLPAAFILLFQTLNPGLINSIAPQNFATLIVGAIFFILYTCYQQKRATEKSFIIGLLFAFTALFYARILYLLPIFLLGMYQMQTGSIRTFAATLVGLVTPYWIVWGIGWGDALQFSSTNFAISLQIPTFTWQMIPAIFVMLLGLIAGMVNLINNYNENIKTRAMNGFVNILSVYTALLMIIDNSHYTTYLPLLNCVVTLQLSYLFTSQHSRLYNILFFTLITLLLGSQVWMFWI